MNFLRENRKQQRIKQNFIKFVRFLVALINTPGTQKMLNYHFFFKIKTSRQKYIWKIFFFLLKLTFNMRIFLSKCFSMFKV